MPKREIVLVVDVETCGDLARPMVYDLGIAAVERSTGRIVESHSLVIPEVFYGMADDMQSAYYANKLPQYIAGIESGAWNIMPFWAAWNLVRDMVKRYGVKRVYAYNAAFDKKALNATMQAITANRFHNFFPRGVKMCCIWTMACQTIMRQGRFRRFCESNGFVSPAGNLRTSAEVAYAYMTKNPKFEESHTGLDDVKIETEILHYILRQRKKVNEKPKRDCWKIPQERTMSMC
jgi:hypothetical protein